jgi:NAD(P) transhydrogenase subunit alpha
MHVAVPKESQAGETRVAIVPETARKLAALKASVMVESGAGIHAGAADADYEAAGATVTRDRAALLETADIVATVNRLATEDLARIKSGAVVVGFLRPLDEPAELGPIVARNLTAFAMELVPRTTRAQAMDALSSMATIVGYKAVILAAEKLPRMFPLLMTAAGTIAPARALVLGAGVAGLQAIATARRLGAVVEAYDVRAAAGEHVRSLGATFLEVDLGGIETEDEGGYAKELTEEALARGRDLVKKHARSADVVITSAQVPGRAAPLMVTEEAVAGMRSGSVIVDLAAPTGGNCAVTRPGETVEAGGVTVMGPLNLAATVPVHSSQLYSRNVSAFLHLLIKDGQLNLDMDDDIIGPTCVAHSGRALHPRVAAALGGASG